MKLYDISQEVFSCAVFPGDPVPEKREESRIEKGSVCNLTSFSMCAHNGTHIDAPFHFLNEGDTVERIPLEKTVGECLVTSQDSDIAAEKAQEIVATGAKRILMKGTGVVTAEAAKVFADAGVYLVGVESQTVGPEDGPMAVHEILLGAKVVLLEGLRLEAVEEGAYLLSAAPLNLGGCDGAPCRAVLLSLP